MSRNYKIGSRFRVTSNSTNGFNVGEIVDLVARRVDGLFEMDNGAFQQALYEDQFELVCEPLSQKLKPAKQALADAIHQNGGWPIGVHWLFSTSSRVGSVGSISFWVCRPKFNSTDWFEGGARCVTIMLNRGLPNWHQCILSRGEYFIAYPEQVKVEVRNETQHKVEVEMKSESEMTIKVCDWHKNGELPPVGEVCEAYITSENIWVEIEVVAHKDGFALGWCRNEKCGYHGDEKSDFRPIRTERDKAIDEMVDCLSSRWANCEEITANLYDAGYRKEVK